MFTPYGAAINTVNMAGVYPTYGGGSVGIQGTAMSDGSALGVPPMMAMVQSGGGGDAPVQGNGEVANAVSVGAMGSPAAWWISLTVALFLLMFLARRFGSEGGDFANIKLSVYNVIIIALAAVIGMTLLKALFTKVPVPGLSTLVLAA